MLIFEGIMPLILVPDTFTAKVSVLEDLAVMTSVIGSTSKGGLKLFS